MNIDRLKRLTGNCLCALLLTACSSGTAETLQSPDGRLSLTAGVKDGCPYYSLAQGTETLINPSALGFILEDGPLDDNFRLKEVRHSTFDETWAQPWGEEVEVRNHYNELTLDLEERNGLKRRLSIVFRLFDDGLGFRYVFPEQENLKQFVIMDEKTEYAFPWDAKAWSIPTNGTKYYEALFTASPLSRKDTISTPVTLEVNDSLYMVLHEADLTDYASLNLTPGTNKQEKGVTLRAALTPWSTGEKVFAAAPFATPWRTIIVGKTPGDLMLSRLMLNLNEPCKLEDTSWIEPGRYVGIWWGMHMEKYTWAQGPKHGATTANTMRYIDFAAKHGFSGVLVEGWNYGWDGDWTENGDAFSFTKPYPDYDLKKLADYARQKGVRLIGHNETGGAATNYEQQLDSAYALYRSLGINAVKTGYVNPMLDHKELQHSQYGVRHYRKVIETAARYGIMIDNHEPAMPTGLQRTYPNLMTQEGVRGQEYNAWSPDGGNPPEHTCVLPFTRGLAGPMDFTPGIFNFRNPVFPGTHPQTTLAKQLALYVVLFSPLQMAADMIENYENQPAFSFITSCPTTWAKTVIPDAKIGEFVTIARKDRNSEDWFVGSITDAEARTLELPLDFLSLGASYKATVYEDGEGADYKTNPYPVKITEEEVTADSILTLQLAPGGGTAIRIEKL
ncbi:glycoside hydrolase family 97 protein [Bacteroides sp. GD17]|jgi:alpha-glucosidase|uniref:glycoside hydrolase family 97 protein n=1 Tax=Bacteroides sp. GD17 TaxID=3139826 RepID=UPI0025F3E754|nr:glycoside hydrolase family 97 protein [uncultured Bacteroides sp.]